MAQEEEEDEVEEVEENSSSPSSLSWYAPGVPIYTSILNLLR